MARGGCQPWQHCPRLRQPLCPVAGGRWQRGQHCQCPHHGRGALLGIAAIRPRSVEPAAAGSGQIRMLNGFKEAMIYWLDLIQ